MLPDFGFGSKEKENAAPRSPPGPVERTLLSIGKGLSSFLPGTPSFGGGERRESSGGGGGIVGTPTHDQYHHQRHPQHPPGGYEYTPGSYGNASKDGLAPLAGGFGAHALSSRGTPKR